MAGAKSWLVMNACSSKPKLSVHVKLRTGNKELYMRSFAIQDVRCLARENQ